MTTLVASRNRPSGPIGSTADAAARVVGDEHVAAGAIDADVAGVCAVRGLLVQQREAAGDPVDLERADRAALLALVGLILVHGVQPAAVRVHHEEARVRGCRRETDRPQRAGALIEPEARRCPRCPRACRCPRTPACLPPAPDARPEPAAAASTETSVAVHMIRSRRDISRSPARRRGIRRARATRPMRDRDGRRAAGGGRNN